jgi:hypothetical protein
VSETRREKNQEKDNAETLGAQGLAEKRTENRTDLKVGGYG